MFTFFKYNNKKKKSTHNVLLNHERGFTLLELIVVMIIFVSMTSVVMFNFRGFSDNTNLSNLVYDIALEIKTSQTLGSSTLDTAVTEQNLFGKTWVITEISKYIPNANDGNSITTFRDTGGGNVYGINDPGDGDVTLRSSEVLGGQITSIATCVGNSCDELNAVYIGFRRPRPEPIVFSQDCSGSSDGLESGLARCSGHIEITVQATGDQENTGQIIVESSGHIHAR